MKRRTEKKRGINIVVICLRASRVCEMVPSVGVAIDRRAPQQIVNSHIGVGVIFCPTLLSVKGFCFLVERSFVVWARAQRDDHFCRMRKGAFWRRRLVHNGVQFLPA